MELCVGVVPRGEGEGVELCVGVVPRGEGKGVELWVCASCMCVVEIYVAGRL